MEHLHATTLLRYYATTLLRYSLLLLIAVFISINKGTAQQQPLPNDPYLHLQTYLNVVKIPQAWNYTTGNSNQRFGIISIGGFDTQHEDLAAKSVLKNSITPGFYEYGTAAAGIIGASTNNNLGIAGINWHAQMNSYDVGKMVGQNAVLDNSQVHLRINDALNDGVDFIYLPIHMLNPDIENVDHTKFLIDLGYQATVIYFSPTITNIYNGIKSLFQYIGAVNANDNAYAFTKASLKNAYLNDKLAITPTHDYNGILRTFPGNLSRQGLTLTVGASDELGISKYQFSSVGMQNENSILNTYVDVIAPGENIFTTINTLTPDYGKYAKTTTTSNAGAIVTGIASLIKDINPFLDVDDVKNIIRNTTTNISGQKYSTWSGFGLVNADEAIKYASERTFTTGIMTASNSTITNLGSRSLTMIERGAWTPSDIAAQTFQSTAYKIETTIALPSGTVSDIWFKPRGTFGTSQLTITDFSPNASIVINPFNNTATITTYTYKVVPTNGVTRWLPANVNHVQVEYTIASKPGSWNAQIQKPLINVHYDDPSHPTIYWDQVPYATSYSIYRENISNGSGFTELLGTTSQTEFIDQGIIYAMQSTGLESVFSYYVIAHYLHHQSVPSDSYYVAGEEVDTNGPGGGGCGSCIGFGNDLANENSNSPKNFTIYQNYPNPFNPSTLLKFDVPEHATVSITAHTINGQKVADIVRNKRYIPGTFTETFNGHNLASGIYIIRINATSDSGFAFNSSIKTSLIK